jgi:predicted unusual protein kinase regulating ubiquinone biosynthesis (AarF/ABC1/UbiB family)
MNPDLAELLAALPADETDTAGLAPGTLEQLFARLEHRRTPVSALHRFGILAGLQAQIALAYTAWWVRGWFRDAATNQQRLLETHLRVALKVLENMGYLRGAVMKIGQTLANLPTAVPDEIVDTLETLHYQAPPMHFSLLREQVRNELGADPEEVFAEFEERPFAAASLGQVHQARLHSGERVAVKIQYPSIAATIRADFRNLTTLMVPLRLSRDWEYVKVQLADLERVLAMETDYENEAAMLRKARALFREDDGIIVPRVHQRFSTRRVLTMEYLDGRDLHGLLATNPAQERRDHFGELILRAWTRMYYAGRMNYADMHPGNFLFHDDGTLGVIDFGCVRPFNDAEWDDMRLGHLAVYGTAADQRRSILRSIELREDEPIDAEHLRLLEALCEWSWRPLRRDGAFDFGDGKQIREGLDIFRGMVRKRYTRGQPLCVFIARMQFGYRGLLYHLRARVDCQAIDRQEVVAAGWPTPHADPLQPGASGG